MATAGTIAVPGAASHKRIMLPPELDAFTLEEWSSQCRKAGFDVLTESSEGVAEGHFTIVLNEKYTLAQLQKMRDQFGKKAGVRFVSSVVFTSHALGPFPGSLDAFRSILRGCLLCPTALSVVTKKHVQLWCESLGGGFDGTFTGRVTHLIAAKALSDKYAAAAKYTKPIVVPEWVADCFRTGSKVATDLPQYAVGCLLGGTIATIGLSPSQHARAQQLVAKANGVFLHLDEETRTRLAEPPSPSTVHTPLKLFEQGVTHIVAAWPVPGQVIDQAHAKKIPVASLAWLEEFVASAGAKASDPREYPVRSEEEEEHARAQAQAAKEKEADKKRADDTERKRIEAEQQREQQRLADEAEAAATAAREQEQNQLRAEQEERASIEQERQQAARDAAAAATAAAAAAAAATAAAAAAAALVQPEDQVVYDPSNDEYLSGLQIILFALDSRSQQDMLIKMIRFGGGSRLTTLAGRESALHQSNVNCTVPVLVVGGSQRRDTLDEKLKIECANRNVSVTTILMPAVTHHWLVECHRQKRAVPYAPFLVPAADATPVANAAATPSAPQRTVSRAPQPLMTFTSGAVQRQSSTNVSYESELDRTLDVSSTNGRGDGAVDFSAFNSSITAAAAHRSALPPPAPASAAGASSVAGTSTAATPAILKMAATSTSAALASSKAHLFAGITFVLEDADDSEDATAPEESKQQQQPDLSHLRALRFSTSKRLTVRKQLTDYGAADSMILDPHFPRNAATQIKGRLRYVIGGVCGSTAAPTATLFKARYGAQAEFASHLWVAACVKHERLLPLSPPNICWDGSIPRALCPKPSHNAAAARAATALANVSGFAAFRLSGSGFSSEESELLGALIKHAGGEFTAGLNKSNTHLVFNEAGARKEANKEDGASTTAGSTAAGAASGSKLQLALKLNLKCVQPLWVLDCLKQHEALPEANYSLSAAVLEAAAPPAGAASSSSRRSGRSVTPMVAPDTPSMLAPDTPALPAPSAAAVAPALAAPPTPLPPSHFTAGPAAAAAADDEGVIPDDLIQAGEEDDEDEEDLARGFGNALRGANLFAQGKSAIPSPNAVRSKRAGKKANTPAAPAVSAAAAPAARAVAAPAPVAVTPPAAAAASKPTAKEAFQQTLKQKGSLPPRRGSRGAAPAVTAAAAEDEEAELEFAPAARSVPPAPRSPAEAESRDAAPMAISPAISPFKSARGGKGSAAGAAIATLANASSTIVAPQLAPHSSGKKTFKKLARPTPPATPQSTPPTAAPTTPLTPIAAAHKRVRRRVVLEDLDEDESAAAAEPAAAEPAAVEDEAPAEEELVPITTDDDEQPGSHVKPSRAATTAAKKKSKATAKPAATREKSSSSKKKATPKSKKKKKGDSDDEEEEEEEEDAYVPSDEEPAEEEAAAEKEDSDEGEAEYAPPTSKSKATKPKAKASPAPKAKAATTTTTPKRASRSKKAAAAEEPEAIPEAEEEEEVPPSAPTTPLPVVAAAAPPTAPTPAAAAPVDAKEPVASSSGTEDDAEDWMAIPEEKSEEKAAEEAAPSTRGKRKTAAPPTPVAATPTRTPRAPPRNRGAPAAAAAAAAAEEQKKETGDEEESEPEAKPKRGSRSTKNAEVASPAPPVTPASKPAAAEKASAAPAAAAAAPVEPAAAPVSPVSAPVTPITPVTPSTPVVASSSAAPNPSRFARRTPPAAKLPAPVAGVAKLAAAKRKQAEKTGAPMRSDSLGGAPEGSLADIEAAKRAQARSLKPKRTAGTELIAGSQDLADDPFAYVSEDQAETPAAKPAKKAPAAVTPAAVAAAASIVDTQALTETAEASAASTAVADKSSTRKKGGTAAAAAAAVASKKKPSKIEEEKEELEEGEAPATKPTLAVVELGDDDPTPPASPAVAAKKTPASKRATAAAATAAAASAAAESTPAATGRGKRIRKSTKKDEYETGEDEESVAPSEPAASRASKAKTPKRKRGEEEEEKKDRDVSPPRAATAAPAAIAAAPRQPEASPLKRSLSTKAALSLSSLKSAEPAEGEEEAKDGAAEEEEKRPAKKSKTKAAAEKKAAAVAVPTAEVAAADAPSKPSRSKKKPTAAADDSPASAASPAAPAKSKKKAAAVEVAEASETPSQNKKKRKQDTSADEEPEAAAASSPKKAKTKAAASKSSSAAAAASSSSPPRLFTLTGFTTAQKPRYAEYVNSLAGGVLVSDEELDYGTLTHIVCDSPPDGKLKRSEKLLVSMCAKQFLLHPSYLEACSKAGTFVEEAPFEWHRLCSASDPLRPALKRWHHGAGLQPYAGWRVVLDVASAKAAVYMKLLSFGGAQLVDRNDRELTHLFIETTASTVAEFKKSGGKQLTAAQAIIARQSHPENIIVARAEFIIEHLAAGNDEAQPILLMQPAAAGSSAASRTHSAASTPARRCFKRGEMLWDGLHRSSRFWSGVILLPLTGLGVLRLAIGDPSWELGIIAASAAVGPYLIAMLQHALTLERELEAAARK